MTRVLPRLAAAVLAIAALVGCGGPMTETETGTDPTPTATRGERLSLPPVKMPEPLPVSELGDFPEIVVAPDERLQALRTDTPPPAEERYFYPVELTTCFPRPEKVTPHPW